MSKKIEILLVDSSDSLKLSLQEKMKDSKIIKKKLNPSTFNYLSVDIKIILVYVDTFSQNLTSFLRQIKNSQYSTLPIIALIDKRNESFTKNVLKLGFSNFVFVDSQIDEIVINIRLFIENFQLKQKLFSKISVAIIDDDFLHNELIKRLLSSNGVQKVNTFQSAQDFFQNAIPFDVFLVDLVMKNSNGTALIKKITEMYPSSLIFIISSLNEERIISTTFEAGADDFIPKPISAHIFLAKIFSRIKKRSYFLSLINNKETKLD